MHLLFKIAVFYGYFILSFEISFGDNSFTSSDKYNGQENGQLNTGEIAYVKLLTIPKLKRDLSSYSYHIMEINIPSKNKTITVHLTKETTSISSDYQTFVRDYENGVGEPFTEKINEGNDHDCFYSGVIPGNMPGTASLSSCDKDSPGFTGVIVESEKHFILQPLKHRHTGTFADNSYILHTMQEARTVTKSPVGGIPAPGQEIDEWPSKVKREVNEEIIFDDPLTETKNDLTSLLMPLAVKSGKSTSSANGKSKSNSKGDQKVIDLAIFADSALYRRFHKMYPQNTMKNMEAWILTFVNAINIIYQHPSLGVNIQIRLCRLEIMKSDPSDLRPNIDGETYLANFRQFAVKKNPKVDLWDHACLLTAVDIHLQDGNPLLLGMAYDGTMCVPEYYTSIVQADTFESVYVAAHELAHNLGVEHDAEGISASCTTDTFLMAALTGAGKVTWSPCSTQNLKNFLATGVNQKNKKYGNGPKCLDSMTKKAKTIKFSSKQLPGEKYSAKDQCIYSLGADAVPNLDGANSNICYNLVCYFLSGTMTKPIHPALEGTSCGKNKHCRAAVCTQIKGR